MARTHAQHVFVTLRTSRGCAEPEVRGRGWQRETLIAGLGLTRSKGRHRMHDACTYTPYDTLSL